MNVGHVLAQRGRLSTHRPALDMGDRSVTYGELDQRVDRLAAGLAHLGVEKGDRVAILLMNRVEYYEVLFACARLGAMLVTINYRLVVDELRVILEDARPSVLVHGPEYADVARKLCPPEGQVLAVGLDASSGPGVEYEELQELGGAQPPAPTVELDDPLIIMYTSGTTGTPKGAVLTHGNVLWTSFNQIVDFGVRADDVALGVAPLYHCGGLLIFTFPCLHVGGRVHLHASFDPSAVLRAIEQHRVTTMFLAPTMWRMLLECPEAESTDLTSMRVGASGGESLPVAVMRQLTGLFGAEFTDGYGLTEASSCSTVLRPEHVFEKAGSVGLPLLHNAIRVVDRDGRDVGPGEIGEIVQAGPTVMQGYWRRPEATAEAIRDGWLHTGDLGRFDQDGFLYVVDREKDMIISGAENVYPAEIEQVLYQHPAILEAAVIGTPDERWGERVTAVVVLRDGMEATADDVIDFCRGRVAGFKRPRSVIFVGELPRNPSGKVLKHRLRQGLAQPSGDGSG